MGLLDMLQDRRFWSDVGDNAAQLGRAASNAAATNVTGPVDIAAFLLSKIGLPVGTAPVGGTEWARQNGLTTGPQSNQMAQIVGETLGNVAPFVGVAKAPEIAGGLLQMIRNAQAPSAANQAARNQLGAIVYHGSPHKFDRFDASKIGTGEGAQAYGHGLYFAESPDTASFYKAALTDRFPAKLDGKQAAELSTAKKSALGILNDYGGNVDGALAFAKRDMAKAGNAGADFHAERYNTLFDIKRGRSTADVASPSLYKVDLPDNAIARMLDWDKPLSQQNTAMQAIGPEADAAFRAVLGQPLDRAQPQADMAYKILADRLGGQDKAAQFLRSKGIPGIRYLDGGSRGAGAGSSNFVVFPGEESLLSILERNGKALP